MPFIKQFLQEESSCASYLLGCPSSSVGLIVDPMKDVSPYIEYSKNKGIEIGAVIETHIHADHISGSRNVNNDTGARIYMFEDAGVNFSFEPLKDNQFLKFGNIGLKIIHTPGHTPESMSLLYYDMSRSANIPNSLFTGDTLFVGDVGRPDLAGQDTTRDLYESITEKILPLPDYVELFPAHYSGSACGANMSPKTSSTLGYERLNNELLLSKSYADFRKNISFLGFNPIREMEKIRSINMGEYEYGQ
ncbi:MAG: MBL fold metallo-hydrolase [Thermoplasmataceae archaeon]|jgi:glyoxylase-like metal-dependent hydrolase (beta-lactamase superfamily II)